jgi:zinc finger protein-like protein
MESPIRSIRFIHKAIRTETEMLESAVNQLAPDDVRAAEECARRHAFLYDTIKTHEDGEEAAIFPLIDERAYPVSAPYLLDHRVDQLHMQESGELFTQLTADGDAGERAEVVRHLRRQAVVVSSAMALHIRKEEDILVPLVEQRFSFEEQAEMVRDAVGHFTPQQQQVVLPWILKAHTPDDQEAFLRMLMQDMPPEMFRAATRWAADGVSPAQWEEIVRRIPEAA